MQPRADLLKNASGLTGKNEKELKNRALQILYFEGLIEYIYQEELKKNIKDNSFFEAIDEIRKKYRRLNERTYKDMDQVWNESEKYITNAKRILDQEKHSNRINAYLKSLPENKEAVEMLQEMFPEAYKTKKHESGHYLLHEAMHSREQSDAKSKALQILYFHDLMDSIRKSEGINQVHKKSLDDLYKDLDKLLSGRISLYMNVEDIWNASQVIINNAKEILNQPKYTSLVEAYKKSLNQNEANAQETAIELHKLRTPTLLTEITHRPDVAEKIIESKNAINRFQTWREKTKKHLVTDIIHKSHKDKEGKGKSAKTIRSNKFRNSINVLESNAATENEKLIALVQLSKWTHDNIEKSESKSRFKIVKSGSKSRFKKELEGTIKPMLKSMQDELIEAAKNDKSGTYDITISTLKEIDYINPRKEFAFHLRQYIDTINLTAAPNMKYLQSAQRLFTHFISPKKKDELCNFLEKIYSDILNKGDINEEYFVNAKDMLSKIAQDKVASKILDNLRVEFRKDSLSPNQPTTRDKCGFIAQTRNAPEQTDLISEKRNYLEYQISRNFYFLNLAHGIGSTGMFAENKRGYGQAADFIASLDTSALNAVAPGISIVQNIVVAGLDKVDQDIRDNERANSSSIRYDRIDDIGKALAKLITDRFAFQLQSLYFSPKYTQTMDTLSQCVVQYALTNLNEINTNGRLQQAKSPEKIAAVLLESALTPSFRVSTPNIPLNPFRTKLDHVEDKGIFQKKRDWTVDGLFIKTGYVVANEKNELTFYKPPGTEPEKYGYAFLSKDQAAELNKDNSGYERMTLPTTLYEEYKKAIPLALRTEEKETAQLH